MEQTKAGLEAEKMTSNQNQFVRKEEFDALNSKIDKLIEASSNFLTKPNPVVNTDYGFRPAENYQQQQEQRREYTLEELDLMEQRNLYEARRHNREARMADDPMSKIPNEDNTRYGTEEAMIDFYETYKHKLDGYNCENLEALKRCDYKTIAKNTIHQYSAFKESFDSCFPGSNVSHHLNLDIHQGRIKNTFLQNRVKFGM